MPSTPLGTTAIRAGSTPKRATSCRASARELGRIRSPGASSSRRQPGRPGHEPAERPGRQAAEPSRQTAAPATRARPARTSRSARGRPGFPGPAPVGPAPAPRATSRRGGAAAPVRAGRSRARTAGPGRPAPRGGGRSGRAGSRRRRAPGTRTRGRGAGPHPARQVPGTATAARTRRIARGPLGLGGDRRHQPVPVRCSFHHRSPFLTRSASDDGGKLVERRDRLPVERLADGVLEARAGGRRSMGGTTTGSPAALAPLVDQLVHLDDRPGPGQRQRAAEAARGGSPAPAGTPGPSRRTGSRSGCPRGASTMYLPAGPPAPPAGQLGQRGPPDQRLPARAAGAGAIRISGIRPSRRSGWP